VGFACRHGSGVRNGLFRHGMVSTLVRLLGNAREFVKGCPVKSGESDRGKKQRPPGEQTDPC
jgi:hypothetical protein